MSTIATLMANGAAGDAVDTTELAAQVADYDPARPDSLVESADAAHPANEISRYCAQFYQLGWVTGTGGGMSIRRGPLIWFAPTGVQKEQMRPADMFVLWYRDGGGDGKAGETVISKDGDDDDDKNNSSVGKKQQQQQRGTRVYVRRPTALRPSQCTPLFLAAFDRGAGACIHTHSQWAVLVTLLVERQAREQGRAAVAGHHTFEIEQIEQIKGIPAGRGRPGMLGYYDRLVVPVIENTAHEEDLTDSLTAAMEAFPDSYAVLVRRHGVYVWGDTTAKAKTQCESLDYIFQLAVRMHELGLAWTKE